MHIAEQDVLLRKRPNFNRPGRLPRHRSIEHFKLTKKLHSLLIVYRWDG